MTAWPHGGAGIGEGTMASNTLSTAVAAIRDALATEQALEDARRGMRTAWAKAYAATRTAQEAGQTQADIGKAAKVSAATVGDYLTASGIHPSAWDVLEVLPARQGVRFTTIHSLIAGARKASGTPVVRAIVADAAAKVRDIPREDGAAPDLERVSKVWATAVRKLWEASSKPKAQTPPPPPDQGEGDDQGEDQGETIAAPAPKADTLETRVGRVTADLIALRDALAKGSGDVSDAALHGLMREAGAIGRDIADLMADRHARAAS